jgi:hypothetical protein
MQVERFTYRRTIGDFIKRNYYKVTSVAGPDRLSCVIHMQYARIYTMPLKGFSDKAADRALVSKRYVVL